MAEYKGLNISPLRKFTKSDWYEYAGASKIGDSEPLIGESDYATTIISGSEDPKSVELEIDLGESDITYLGTGIKLQTAIRVAKRILDQESIDDSVNLIEDEYHFMNEI